MSSNEASSPSNGWRGLAEAMDSDYSLAEYIDEFRNELEAIAEESHVISSLVHALLDRHDREERQC